MRQRQVVSNKLFPIIRRLGSEFRRCARSFARGDPISNFNDQLDIGNIGNISPVLRSRRGTTLPAHPILAGTVPFKSEGAQQRKATGSILESAYPASSHHKRYFWSYGSEQCASQTRRIFSMTEASPREQSRRKAQSARPPRSMMSSIAAVLKTSPA